MQRRSVAEQVYRVELTASFLECLDGIEAFLTEADAAFAFDGLLAELRAAVIPNLARFPTSAGATWTTRRNRPRPWPSLPRCRPALPVRCGSTCTVTT